MLTSPSGDGVILIGGFNASYRAYSEAILEWKYHSKSWVILNQKLQFPRELFVAMYIPSELINQKQKVNEDNLEEKVVDCNLMKNDLVA